MSDKQNHHLQLIQDVITRMASNSFFVKGWTVTLVAGLFALSAKDAAIQFVVIAYLPTMMFWVLDGYFLWQERKYRDLYDYVRQNPNINHCHTMNASGYRRYGWWGALCSKTLVIFYVSLLAIIAYATHVVT